MTRRVAGAAMLVVLLVGLLLVSAAPATAHPLGNFTTNRHTGIVVRPGAIDLHTVIDFAEIPTVQSMADIDQDVDGVASEAERAAWADLMARRLRTNLDLVVDGRRADLTVTSASASVTPGQAEGTFVIRLEADYTAPVSAESGTIDYADRNFPGTSGWHEITAIGADGRVITGESLPPQESPSDELRTYPEDLLASPPAVTEVAFGFAPGDSGPVPESFTQAEDAGGSETISRLGIEGGAFTGLLTAEGFSIVALLLAFAFGAAHALAPGHGKTIMAAYLVGAGAKTKQAVIAGGAVALMHTLSVIGLGMLILFAEELVAPEEVFPWLGLVSGIVVLGLGTWLLVVRARALGWREGYREAAGDDAHDHKDDAVHAGHDHGHEHPQLPAGTQLLSGKGLGALAVSGGLLPSPTALVVLLGAVAIGRVGFGLALIISFSIGLACALIAVALLAVGARDVVGKRLGSRVGRLVPVLGAVVILVVGAYLVVRAAMQIAG